MIKRFFGIRKVQVGMGIMIFFILIAIFGPWFSQHVIHFMPYDFDDAHMGQPPSTIHWLGTTSSGQDCLSWILNGGSTSMKVGLLSAVVGTALSVVFGLVAGFCGGAVDRFLNGVTLVFQNIPSFALLFMIAAMVPDAGWVLISLIIGGLEWTGGARGIRAQALSLRGRDFTTSLQTIGESNWRIIFSEVMPHLSGIISPMFLRLIAAGVNMQSALAFLGIGNAAIPSWGVAIANASAQNGLFNGYWWWFFPPGICIALIGFATTLINFGLDEITNPTLSTKRMSLMRKFVRAKAKRDQLRAEQSNSNSTIEGQVA